MPAASARGSSHSVPTFIFCASMGEDEGTPGILYHVVQKSLWDKAAGENYFPPAMREGFIHATHDANLRSRLEAPKHGFIYA